MIAEGTDGIVKQAREPLVAVVAAVEEISLPALRNRLATACSITSFLRALA